MKQYNLNGHIFEDRDNGYFQCLNKPEDSFVKLYESDLIFLGATPIDDKSECLHEGDKTNFNPQYCHKCGKEFIYDRFCSPEWKGQHSPDCQCHKKIEPMEIKPTDEDSRALTKTIQKVYEIIDWINNHERRGDMSYAVTIYKCRICGKLMKRNAYQVYPGDSSCCADCNREADNEECSPNYRKCQYGTLDK